MKDALSLNLNQTDAHRQRPELNGTNSPGTSPVTDTTTAVPTGTPTPAPESGPTTPVADGAPPPTTPKAPFAVTGPPMATPTGSKEQQAAESWTPTYNVGTPPQPVKARTAFRMVGGSNQDDPQVSQRKIYGGYDPATKKNVTGALTPKQMKAAGVTAADVNAVTTGRGTAAQVRRVTQALIDAGHLDDPDIQSPQTKDQALLIRRMQWKYGVGVDCQGSLRSMITQTTGKTIANAGSDLITVDTSGNPTGNAAKDFRAVAKGSGPASDITAIKPGHVIKLDDTSGAVGHYVMVTDSKPMPEADAKKLGCKGPVQVMTVFSSWGASGKPDSEDGGARSETWVCDTGAQPPKWGTLGTDGAVDWAADVHKNHTFVGAYAVK